MHALWRRLDRSGHDAAFLGPEGDGWRLSGAAVFAHEEGSACLVYTVDVDRQWAAVTATVTGFVGDRSIDYQIVRAPEGWRLSGVAVPGLSGLKDLDLSFTPATNALQLRRAAPAIGQTLSLPAAWFDFDRARLVELPQIYQRLSATTYRYAAPSVSYEGVLEVTTQGFIRIYPGLWRLESG